MIFAEFIFEKGQSGFQLICGVMLKSLKVIVGFLM